MLEKYRAIIHGNTIEWDGDSPKDLRSNGEIMVDVTVVDRSGSANEPNGRKAVEILQRIADRGGIKSIPDPDQWLRETREDRPLPGRE